MLIRDQLRQTGDTLHGAAVSHGLPRDAIRRVLDGHTPRLDRAAAICDALGLEFYLGLPRPAAPPQGDAPALPPDLLRDLETVARTLNQVVLDAGGDPVPPEALKRLTAADGDMPAGLVAAPFYRDVRASAGGGEPVFEEETDSVVAVHPSVLPASTDEAALACIRVRGRSMVPTIDEDDIVLLDTSRTEPIHDELFVLQTEDGLIVKRMRREYPSMERMFGSPARSSRPGIVAFTTAPTPEWRLVSDDDAYPARRITTQDRVIGRVVLVVRPM